MFESKSLQNRNVAILATDGGAAAALRVLNDP